MINLEKRKRIMQRSMMLGHCICNPKQACPCELFKEKNVCLCAGERLEDAMEDVQLTKFVENAGCASKINQNDLKKVLAGLPEISDPRVLVSASTCDDAGVFQLDGGEALVQSVDVFTPNVDDAYTFGQIAAANSVSDIYAMGGNPLTALSIIGFPIEKLSHKVMNQILRGGIDKMSEAGVVVIGGHSINDQDIKFGFAVTGLINPSRIVTNNAAKPGDVLVLTKPIGVGVISFAHQMGKASHEAMAMIGRTMSELNRNAAEIMVEMGVCSATDVTGFGLLGHLAEMVRQSAVTAEVYVEDVPVFEEALDLIREGVVSGAIERNKEYASQYVHVADGVPEEMQYVLYDPQTSGGLLMCVPSDKAEVLVGRLKDAGIEYASVIGKVVAKSRGEILLMKSPDSESPKTVSAGAEEEVRGAPSGIMGKPARVGEGSIVAPVSRRPEPTVLYGERPGMPVPPCCELAAKAECCASPPEVSTVADIAKIKEKFSAFMGAVNSEGAISLRNKELISIALSVVCKCEPCVKIHIDKARSLGIGQAEIDEAVWMGIAFGGAPVMMFYNTIMGKK
ncbi:MAG: selenide, water dikinase SelD [bacterium]|nr:selenide, water dikinase SelD [bacterium]